MQKQQATIQQGGSLDLMDDKIRKEISSRVKKNHLTDLIIGKLDDDMVTRRRYVNFAKYVCFVSFSEPKNVKEALLNEYCVRAMQEELEQFARNDVWTLVPRLDHSNVIGTKWIFKKKFDEFEI